MNRSQTELALEPTTSNSAGFTQVPGLHESNLMRDIGIQIRRVQNGNFTIALTGRNLDSSRLWFTDLPLTSSDLFRLVQDCRAEWQKTIVDYQKVKSGPLGQKNYYPFQEVWDQRVEAKKLIDQLVSNLAVAGDRLFYLIFEKNKYYNDPVLKRIAEYLRDESTKRPLVITIHSDSFFVPWGMLYTHPHPGKKLKKDGSNYDLEGFWGFRHIMEHNIAEVELETEVKPNLLNRIPTSVNIDEGIDAQLKIEVIKSQLSFFNSMNVLSPQVYKLKKEFLAALAARNFSDKIIYFYCHGVGAGDPNAPHLANASIALTDGQAITGTDLEYYLRSRYLASNPVIFINACQGGQMTTIFYETLGAVFLKKKAVSLIGAQIDIPAVFAAEYGQQFFQGFLKREETSPGSGFLKQIRIGPLMRDLARNFMITYQNPLGLVYSLYRGADCFVNWSNSNR